MTYIHSERRGRIATAPDSSVRKATPSDNTERTARSGAVVETIVLSRPRRAQCMTYSTMYNCGPNTELWGTYAISKK